MSTSHIKCVECGKFCIPTDYGRPWGSFYDLDQPEEIEQYCKNCANKMIKQILISPMLTSGWWIKPTFVSIAKSILRHRQHNRSLIRRIQYES